MKSDDITIEQLFSERRQYMVPFYQRAYVWNRSDQWEQLWEDIQTKADDRLFGESAPHFLGAVVLGRQPKRGLIGVETFHIIDGQQRLATLQFALKSLYIVLNEMSESKYSKIIENFLFNSNVDMMGDPNIEIFKVWPTFRDREEYKLAFDTSSINELRGKFPKSFTQRETLRKIGIKHPPVLEAIWYFSEQFQGWINSGEACETSLRIETLISAILKDIKIVSIVLDKEDDAQVIFETLNGRGARLHAIDLIRNFIFMRADREGVDSQTLYKKYWLKFEDDYWGGSQTRGRMTKPKLEWFIHSSLLAELCEEVDLGRLYFEYRRYVLEDQDNRTAENQLISLSKYSEIYQELLDGDGNSPLSRFGSRIAPYEVTTFHPLALYIASAEISIDAKGVMLNTLASYVVRRAICGLTTKNYNHVVVSILRQLSNSEVSPESLHRILCSSKNDASRWPDNYEFRNACKSAQLYPGALDAPKMRSFLNEIESGLQDAVKTELKTQQISDNLDIDHILPQSWYEFWPLSDGEKVQWQEVNQLRIKQYYGQELSEKEKKILEREDSIGTLGNLTLLNLSVNRGAQNKSYSTKKRLLLNNTNLRLNIPLLDFESWGESEISARSRELTDIALKIWPGVQA